MVVKIKMYINETSGDLALCQAAPSYANTILSLAYASDKCFKNIFIQIQAL